MTNPQSPSGVSVKVYVRSAQKSDTDFLLLLENECFALHRQSTRRSISNSIKSPIQEVLIADVEDADGSKRQAGAAIAFLYKRALRIYSIAVYSQFRRMGIGEALMQHLLSLAEEKGYDKVTLEADAANPHLINWYRKFGFEIHRFLEDYYIRGESAYRMIRSSVTADEPSDRIVLVTDDDVDRLRAFTAIPVFSARDYLSDSRFSRSNHYHVINFCNSYRNHSMGYYVSLLASARGHRVAPSAMTYTDCTNHSIAQSLLSEIKDLLIDKLRSVKDGCVEITIILGRTVKPQFSEIGRKLFALFELPCFTLALEMKKEWQIKKIQVLSLKQVMNDHPTVLKDALASYQEKKRYRRTRLRTYQYDLAILVNHSEETAPSCPVALEKFRKAAEDVGFFVEFISKADKRRICEFDALFIRETTALDNHTYSMARHAYTEGLVVIDDPWSILLCSNKVYLHERMANAGIRQPEGWLLTKKNCTVDFLKTLKYPVVLKLPESSFSLGVFRVENPEELEIRAKQMFTRSDLIIAQEFLVSDYDWRIGILDNQPLFACKYYMANGHWQIYNWQSEQSSEVAGRHETVPISHVPGSVIRAAVKASSLIGNGFYGVDLKEIGQKAFVIEVNDNPNVDFGVEDTLLGDELYRRVMTSIFNRIEADRNQIRYLT